MPSPTIPEFLTDPYISGIVRSADIPREYIMHRWFPVEPVTADEFEGLVQLDENALAPFVALDAETPRMADDMISSYKWSVAYIRYKKAFKESDLRVFSEPGVSDPNTLAACNAAAQEAKIRRYVDALSASIDATLEWIATQAIQGSVAYDDNHAKYSITYPGAYIGASKRKTPAHVWDDSSATVLADLSNWVEEIADETGWDQWVLVASQRVLGVMARDQGVREAWAAAALNPAAASPDSLPPAGPLNIQFVSGAVSFVGLAGAIRYNARYTTRTPGYGADTRVKNYFLDPRDVFLLPYGKPLGRMATAPAMPNGNQPGKFGWSQEKTDPWVVEVGAGMYAWIDWPPTRLNWVLQARVLN